MHSGSKSEDQQMQFLYDPARESRDSSAAEEISLRSGFIHQLQMAVKRTIIGLNQRGSNQKIGHQKSTETTQLK